MEVAILLRESAVAKSTPGAMGNRETRSGEFCRGMTLFMSYFSRSTRTVYGWVFPDHGGKAQNAIFSFP
ncbi:hypothetical protein OE223_23690, partial [Escherichia coli]|uniref:hypothetical protein n=1 Tax=Escherichia coli TaxID=562 RepID=UPI0021D9C56C